MISKYMRYSQSEKMEIIRLVENSKLPVKRTLKELGVSTSSFYDWYRRYKENGYDGLALNTRTPVQFWNRIPECERQRIVGVAREYPEKSCREVACFFVDNYEYFVSESSVYRILKEYDLISSPVFSVISAKDKFDNPTTRVNELWQIDFTYMKIMSWGWYYLLTILDDYSRYIITWKLCKTMKTDEVKPVIEDAIKKTGISHVDISYRTRLLSDNGSSFVSGDLAKFLDKKEIDLIHGKPYHPQTQGKIERYHRSMKNIILLDNYYTPEELDRQLAIWVNYYNNFRYHEGIDNVTPVDKYFGRDIELLRKRKIIKKRTFKQRRKLYSNLRVQNYFKERNNLLT